jgi:hypothetical protein
MSLLRHKTKVQISFQREKSLGKISLASGKISDIWVGGEGNKKQGYGIC